MAGDLVQVNISMSEEDSKIIDQMMVEDAYDNRSAFVRRLIRLEWQRRQQVLEMGKTSSMTASIPFRQ